MITSRIFQKLLLIVCILSTGIGISQTIHFEETETFFPNSEASKVDDITWGYLHVPENWKNPTGQQIQIAVTVFKNHSETVDNDPVVYLEGGPGASGIKSIEFWYFHPLRETKDIVLLDIRGTGFSKPRLCPNLGNLLFEILAKDQSEKEDEKQKLDAVMACKSDLLSRGITIEAYNSEAVSKDLHALKNQLGYTTWNVYGVSYGTYMAQIYANEYPKDISSLILDSPISDISNYYTENTNNYINSLSLLFSACKNDPGCNANYPKLEAFFYETISNLEQNPITVSVNKQLLETGTFTYNAEDFKITIQQALYNRELIEMIPLLIYQFHDRNEAALGKLVDAFSGLLDMDYGVYFCMSCNEALPYNSIAEYNKAASGYKGLNGGISFYKSDMNICEKWNLKQSDSVLPLAINTTRTLLAPVLVFSGEYDPITPASNGEKIIGYYPNSTFIRAKDFGHVPSLTEMGSKLAVSFLKDPKNKLNNSVFNNYETINFAKNIHVNAGISGFGESINEMDPVFITPFAIAILLMFAFIFICLFKFIKKKYVTASDKTIRLLILLTSLLGIVICINLVIALIEVSEINLYILAFGLPAEFNYIFTLLSIFLILVALSLLFFIIRIKYIRDRTTVFSVIFSNILVCIYFFYWGIL